MMWKFKDSDAAQETRVRRCEQRSTGFARRIPRHECNEVTNRNPNDKAAIVRVRECFLCGRVDHTPQHGPKLMLAATREEFDIRASATRSTQRLARCAKLLRPREELRRDQHSINGECTHDLRKSTVVIDVGVRNDNSVKFAHAKRAKRRDDRLRSSSGCSETSTVEDNARCARSKQIAGAIPNIDHVDSSVP